MGEALVPADQANVEGYFEDCAFLDLNRRMLAASVPLDRGGHPDWGWTEDGLADTCSLRPFLQEAQTLLARRRSSPGPWGWKDPRNTALLDFWQAAAPDARYLLVYRYPWDVSDSIHRLGVGPGSADPRYPDRIWAAYNRRLLDFFSRNAERCLLVSVNRFVQKPSSLLELLQRRFGLPLADRRGASFRKTLFRNTGQGDPLPMLHSLAWPSSWQILRSLEAAADLPSGIDLSIESFSPRLLHKPESAPRFSIVTPVHDDGVYLPEAIASAERGATKDTELIIVDDGSSEALTMALLDRLRTVGYRVMRRPPKGLSAARNAAIAESRAPYILPLDADNRIEPDYLSAAGEVLDRQPLIGVVYGHRREFGLRNGIVQVPEHDVSAMIRVNTIDACAVFRKTVWTDAGGYDESLFGFEDWDLWLSAARAGWQFHHLGRPMFDYRVRPNSLAQNIIASGKGERLSRRIQVKQSTLPRVRREVPGDSTSSSGRAPPGVPHFLIIGAMKGGTTSLMDALVSHPRAVAPARKEIHYFDNNYDLGVQWYLGQLGFKPDLAGIYGEASPYYLFHPGVPGRVAQTCPRVRVIVLLRDPVARAISHYHHACRLGVEHLGLGQALVAETARLNGSFEELYRGLARANEHHQAHSYINRGNYLQQIKMWLKHVPANQLLVIQSEKLFRQPVIELARVMSFLELDGQPPTSFVRLNAGSYPEAPNGIVKTLKALFKEPNLALAEYLKNQFGESLDLSLWS